MKILNSLPDRKNVARQTLLFSATIPQSVHQVSLSMRFHCTSVVDGSSWQPQIASIALLPNHQFISTLTAEDLNTHERVDQFYAAVPIGDLIVKSVEVLLNEYEKEGDAFKGECHSVSSYASGLLTSILRAPDSHVLPSHSSRCWNALRDLSKPSTRSSSPNLGDPFQDVSVQEDEGNRGVQRCQDGSVVQFGCRGQRNRYSRGQHGA